MQVTEKRTDIAVGRADDFGSYDGQGSSVVISAPMYTTDLISTTVAFSGITLDFGGTNGYNQISGLRLTNTTLTSAGDSGAPVFTFGWNSAKSRFDYQIEGVHKGIVTITPNGGSPTQYEVYSSYSGVYNALGLSAIYVAS